jgi:hypothetical protein
LALLLSLFAAELTAALAHSWYPHSCCNDQDCGPVDLVMQEPDGTYVLWRGGLYVLVPRSFPIQVSQDSRAHVCISQDFHTGEAEVSCVFLPANS